jgi:hypothetical protein
LTLDVKWKTLGDVSIVDTFDFIKNALKTFKNGNIDTRKIIFRSLGSNWTLKDKKLQANLNDWLLPLQKSQNSNSLISIRLEPTKKGIRLRKLDASNDRFQLWWRLVEEVRTALQSSDVIPYVPKLV